MKFLVVLLRLFNKPRPSSIIQNDFYPVCKNCVFFRPGILDLTSYDLAKCEKFGKKDILSGHVTYDYADLCRGDENKCGKTGKYFEEEKGIRWRFLLIKNSPFLALALWFSLYGYILSVNHKSF